MEKGPGHTARIESLETRLREISAELQLKNRALEVESALEKVRSRTINMRNSAELSETSALLFRQLKELGIDALRTGVGIFDDANDAMELWVTTVSNNQEVLGILDYFSLHIHPVFENIIPARNQNKPYSLTILRGNQVKEYHQTMTTYIARTGNQEYSQEEYFYSFFFTAGTLNVISAQALSEEECQIIIRFAGVFGLIYTRFSDLQKAEEQTRDARVEIALERVRAVAMSMRKSDELLAISEVIDIELKALGLVALRNVEIALIKERKEVIVSYQYSDYGTTSIVEVSYNAHPNVRAWASELKKISNTFIGKLIPENEMDEWRAYRDELGYPPDPKLKEANELFYYSYTIGEGVLSISSFKPLDEKQHTILERFRIVFNLAHQRHQDIGLTEARTHEASIEAALERVRAKALAMQSSADLIEVANVLREQMGLLGQPQLESSIVHLYSEDLDSFEAWYSFRSGENKEHKLVTGSVKVNFNVSQWSREVLEKYQSTASEYTIISKGDKLKEWYGVLKKVAPETIDYDRYGKVILPEILYYHFSKFSGGTLLTISSRQPSKETKELQLRAASVFDFGYMRYLDLQKAEERARIAVRSASLDRVRAEIASMRNAQDLQRITPLVWRELMTLGVPFFRCGVMIINEVEEQVQFYLTAPDGKPLAALHLQFDSIEITRQSVAHWRQQKVYIDHWDKSQFIAFTKSMLELGQIQTASTYQGGNEPPESLTLQFVPFTQGMMYVGSTDQLSSSQIELVHELAETFSVAYARYEDFTRLETAKALVEHTLKDLRSTQTQLIQSEKMASLGELTAGIAHEIQNPLNFVNNFSELNMELLMEFNEEMIKGNYTEAVAIAKDVMNNQEKINHHGKRAEAIVKGMLQHSRTSTGQKELTDINALCDEYLRLSYHGLRAKDKSFNAKFETDFDSSLQKINVVPQDMGRVILNLINNAFYVVNERLRQAEPDSHYEPTVIVTTKKMSPAGGGKEEVLIAIKDNGNGIPQHIVDKIFQPFFTTKPTGQGTGLGLSLSYDIVKAHGGELKVETREGERTEFIIQLPVT